MSSSLFARLVLGMVTVFSVAQFSRALGQTVEIPTMARPVRLELKRSAHRVALFRGATEIKSYPVAVGRPGWETPPGTFHVFQMLRDPIWVHPLTGKTFPAGDPGNELGHRWIGFAKAGDNSIGFHGTPHPNSVGQSLSHGCVRMYEQDIEELFEKITVGTMVTVLP
jgi:lipoprotein-anchoring transpeptidase ErfK/SrfK